MPAAGHMGFGSSIVMSRSASARMNMSMSYDPLPGWSDRTSLSNDMEFLDIPALMRSSDDEIDLANHEVPSNFDLEAFTDWLNGRVRMVAGRLDNFSLPTLNELASEIPESITDELRLLVGSVSEQQIVGLFLTVMYDHFDSDRLNRNVLRLARNQRSEILDLSIEAKIVRIVTTSEWI